MSRVLEPSRQTAPLSATRGEGRRLFAVGALCAALLSACSDPGVARLALGAGCDPSRPSECADALCVPLAGGEGVCARGCAGEGTCPTGFRCQDSGRFGMVCLRAASCGSDHDCPAGHRCDAAAGQCYVKVTRELCSPCTSDLQCPEGGGCFSVPATGERYCTTACGEQEACPAGYACKEVPFFTAGGEPVARRQCVPAAADGSCEGGGGLCSPCAGDQECGGHLDLCVRNLVSGESFCGVACEPASESACPQGFGCLDMSGEGQGPYQCVPLSNTCEGFCDGAEPEAQTRQCGLGRECDLSSNRCRSAHDGRQCAPCSDDDDCRGEGHESNQCVVNSCADCPSRGESFCAEPCPPVDGDRECSERLGPGFVCAPIGEGRFCVPQRGSCLSGNGRLGDDCSAGRAGDCLTGICLSYGTAALCSAGCALDADCGDPRKWRCCAVAGDFFDCSAALRNELDDGPSAGSGVCAPSGGLFGDDCSPGRAPCQSGTCLDVGTARLCTVHCGADGSCPADFVCRDAYSETDGTPVRVCFPDGGGLPGSDCSFGPAACAEGLCIKKASGPVCTQPCSGSEGCPADWLCSDQVSSVGGGLIEACVPPELQ